MRYDIINGEENLEEIFRELKNHPETTNSYLGEKVLGVYQKGGGFVYDKVTRKIVIVCGEKSGLLKKFNELIKEKGVRLQKI